MDNLQPAKFAPGIVRAHLTIWVGAAEQTRQALETPGIGNGIVDSLQDALVIGQDFAPRPQRIEIQTLRALDPYRQRDAEKSSACKRPSLASRRVSWVFGSA